MLYFYLPRKEHLFSMGIEERPKFFHRLAFSGIIWSRFGVLFDYTKIVIFKQLRS